MSTASTTSTVPGHDSSEPRRDATTTNTTSNNFDSAAALQTNLENLSAFSSLLTSPNQGPLFPLDSPLNSMFPSLQSAFPLTPTQQFMANDIFQNNGTSTNLNLNQNQSVQSVQPPIIQPLQIMNSLTAAGANGNGVNGSNGGNDGNDSKDLNAMDANEQFLLNSMLCNFLPTPAATDQSMDNLSQFEQQLQNMMAIDGLLDLQQIPLDNLQSMASSLTQTQNVQNGHNHPNGTSTGISNSIGTGISNGIGTGIGSQTAKMDNGLHPLHSLQVGPTLSNLSAVVSEAAKPSPNMLSNGMSHKFGSEIKREGLVGKSKQSRKRKIKEEIDDLSQSSTGQPASKRRRGRKKKHGGCSMKDDLELLSERMRRRNDKMMKNNTDHGFIGIRTSEGEIKIPLPAQVNTPYEMFGHACTDKIEDILQAKGRTRYVRGLSEKEKKDRRREQNRNAAARSRARKNAMISKVIQLHQENLGLRAHAAENIGVISRLKREVAELKQLKNANI